ncbi:MAG: chromosome segregation protein SMC [Firmicutes bacterium]|nr:chromosome segregation protein SMC [Bacillota bacterium]
MNFKKLEMHGFKSFAEPVTIEFNEGITGIVGPNGSGKSNISDAIRWVLGEQSPKALRGGKMDEVIFAGTSSRKSRGMAEVTLVIDNEDGSLPIDYQEVAITRRMFRSGESEYHINGNQCRLKDVRDLIMDTGIGVDGYSLIGQGKIADIISNKTEDRREIFEEAAGIVAYRTRKAQAERKLASTTVNMDRVKDIIGEIEGRIDGLREDSIKAKEYLKLRQRYKELEINIILKNIENLELKNEYAKDDLAEMELAIENTRQERAELDQASAELTGQRESLEKIEEETRQKLLAAIEELNAVVNKSEVDSERLNAIERDQERLIGEVEALEQRKQREEGNRRQVLTEKQKLDKEAEEAEEALQQQVIRYNEVAAEMASLSESEDELKDELFRLSGEITRAGSEISSMERLGETLTRRRESLQAEQESGSSGSRKSRDDLERAKGARQERAETLEKQREHRARLQEQLQADQNEEKVLRKEIEEGRIQLGQLSARSKTIEEMEHNYEGYNGAVRFIMKSDLRGIRGVVAELINVPEGYETAIETALGGSLQNIVCNEDADAREAIRSLKRNKAGRMTFLPIASIHADNRRDEKLRSEAGFIGFGPDCVHYDPEYSQIMEYLLGRVILVDHIDNAIRISKKSRGSRVVTLDGEIINSAGAITGGRYRNKTADILERKAEIRSLQEQIRALTESGEEKRKDLEALLERTRKLGEESSDLEGQIRAGEHELLIHDQEIVLAEAALNDFRSSEEKISREMESIRQEMEHSAEVIQKLRLSIEENEARKEQITEESEQMLRQKEEHQAVFDEISEAITKARIAVNTCEERRTHAEYILRSTADLLDQIDRDIALRQEQQEKLRREKDQLTSGHANMDDLIEEKEEAKQRIQEYLEEVSAEKQEANEQLAGSTKERDELAAKLEDLQNKKYELDIRKAKNETQLETYKDKLWEDFEISYIQAMEFKAEKFVMSSAVKENRQIKNRMKEMGEVNVGAIEEYETVKERYEFLTSQQADIQKAMDSLNGIIRDMDKTIRERFKASFDQIVINFEEMFTGLFGGGHAELRLSDENDPLQSNIDIVAQPPGKKLQNINLLSGGEKTLTAIALMFAVLKAKPTPFCILDEVEAALDDANIDRFIQAVRKFEGIQFALVTHQKATMEQADVLYGVTMPEKGVSKVLSLDLGDTSFAEDRKRS